MLVGALSGTNKLGLALVGAAFIVFALFSAFLLPRYRPSFPGRGLRWFVVTSLLFFAGMITAVVVFGREEEKAEAGAKPAKTETGQTGPAAAVRKVKVSLVEFKVRLPAGTSLSAGKYEFDVSNDGRIAHNLFIDGPGVANKGTPTFAPGKRMKLGATLAAGSYEFYCAVPGHREAGMTIRVTVS